MATSRAKKHYRVTPVGLEGTYSTSLWAESEEEAEKVGRLLLGVDETRPVTVGELTKEAKHDDNGSGR